MDDNPPPPSDLNPPPEEEQSELIPLPAPSEDPPEQQNWALIPLPVALPDALRRHHRILLFEVPAAFPEEAAPSYFFIPFPEAPALPQEPLQAALPEEPLQAALPLRNYFYALPEHPIPGFRRHAPALTQEPAFPEEPPLRLRPGRRHYYLEAPALPQAFPEARRRNYYISLADDPLPVVFPESRRRLLPEPLLSLPEDIWYEILTHLPVLTLLQLSDEFNWGRLLCEPNFIACHLKHSPPLLLVHAIEGIRQHPNCSNFVYNYKGPTKGFGESGIKRHNPSPQPDGMGVINIVGACNGVFCVCKGFLAQHFILSNPATQEVLSIPQPTEPDPSSVIGAFAGFGVDIKNDRYILFRITIPGDEAAAEKCQFFNFKTGVWYFQGEDNDSGDVSFRSLMRTTEVVVNGVPYWRVWLNNRLKLVWLDVTNSSFVKGSFAWPDNSTFILCEIIHGLLGAVVWPHAESPSFDVFLREGGVWGLKHRVDTNVLCVRGDMVGVHWDNLIIQELIAANGKSHLNVMKLRDDDGEPVIEDFVALGNSQRVGKLVSYRESLKILPIIG
ncbi:hypothetical protein CASFOL_038064 [Castilleja foliolosa]|uniref:F-box domain-containing protein n=1 Tax=Castilleja foliolosa TaxID=1961234 RepID=A0ABD3BJX2_9LAMI